MQEILVVAAIVLAIYFIPRLMGNKSSSSSQSKQEARHENLTRPGVYIAKISLTGRMRLAILLTLVWIIACAVYFKPWEGSRPVFILATLVPATVFWGAIWVWFGYKKHRR